MRYERKFPVSLEQEILVQQALMLHPEAFRPSYPDRRINNIYFDTSTLDCYRDNLRGVGQRRKVRLRWYGEQNDVIPKPVLEEKHKDNQLGWKKWENLTDGQSFDDLLAEVNNHPVIRRYNLEPVLFNTYLRSYWVSADGRFRVTIDRDLEFGPFYYHHFSCPLSAGNGIIVEWKYAQADVGDAEDFIRFWPFRAKRFSKYIAGIEIILPEMV